MKAKFLAHFVTLPRWFAAPIAACGILLGAFITGADAIPLLLALIAGLFMMAYAHSMNTFLDWSWTRFDRPGAGGEHSHPKVYTHGQQPIAAGVLTEGEVLGNSLIWLLASAIAVIFIGNPWVWLPWGLSALMTFWYSKAKMLYHPEIPLGLGFGPFAVMLGMAACGGTDFGYAFLAGIPFMMLFGFIAEWFDQYSDADADWGKGLRSIGALAWKNGVSMSSLLGWGLVMTLIAQLFLVTMGILSTLTILSILPFPLIALCLVHIDREPKKGVLLGLISIFSYTVLLIIGQAVGG